MIRSRCTISAIAVMHNPAKYSVTSSIVWLESTKQKNRSPLQMMWDSKSKVICCFGYIQGGDLRFSLLSSIYQYIQVQEFGETSHTNFRSCETMGRGVIQYWKLFGPRILNVIDETYVTNSNTLLIDWWISELCRTMRRLAPVDVPHACRLRHIQKRRRLDWPTNTSLKGWSNALILW